MTHWKRLVVCGGIGCGKSAVLERLKAAGYHTINADSVGHEVLMPDGPAFESVAQRWPRVVEDGRIDRSALAEIVFADRGELEALEAITHPHIFGRIRSRVEGIEGPVAVEMPILEHGLGPGWARLVVDCADDVRLSRSVERGMSESDVKSRMSQQPSRRTWLGVADIVVPNHTSRDSLARTVTNLARVLGSQNPAEP